MENKREGREGVRSSGRGREGVRDHEIERENERSRCAMERERRREIV